MVKIQSKGHSLVITLHKQLMRVMGWEKGDDVKIKVLDTSNLLIINERIYKNEKTKKDFFQ